MVYVAPDDSPSAGETYDPREDLTAGERLANQLGGGGGDDDDDDDDRQTYSDIVDDEDLNNSESGMPGAGTPTNDIVSPDPNENSDGDEVTINPDGSASVDTDRTSRTIDEIRENVSDLVGGSESGSAVDELGNVEEAIRDFREDLAGMGEVQSGAQGGFNLGTLGVTALIIGLFAALAAAIGGGESR
ncbi:MULTISPECIES: hypothetical protein [Haloferax]|uniref:Uncharacterized protein n=1 Tax=Haloferax gibbonsii TaxID=35746 RepID=A0A0K1IQC8_HALGI|nr:MULTISPECIES: hypothetical protein [Haloferax]AKU06513.1 hypothetical protein ABY42_01675 [Haloferax gibbonsii]RDZ54341.1 hypothetical protein C5C07_02060 [Haloferax sp. Atlit-4N]